MSSAPPRLQTARYALSPGEGRPQAARDVVDAEGRVAGRLAGEPVFRRPAEDVAILAGLAVGEAVLGDGRPVRVSVQDRQLTRLELARVRVEGAGAAV